MKPEATKTPRPWHQALARWTATLLMLWFVFGFLLPKFIDYREVIETLSTLRLGETLTLLLLAVVFSLPESWVYTGVIPGLEFWAGWQAYQASGSLAAFAPPGVDMAVRYGMYRTFGVPAGEAVAGFIISGIFTIGI